MTVKKELVDAKYFLPLGDVAGVAETQSGVTFQIPDHVAADRDLQLRVRILAADVIRFDITREAESERLRTLSCAVQRDVEESMSAPFEVQRDGDVVRIRTAEMIVAASLSPLSLSARRPDGSVIFETAPVAGKPGAFLTLNDQFMIARKLNAADEILGLGEKTGSLNRNGRNFTLWNTDVLNPNAAGEFTAGREKTDPRNDASSIEFDPYYMSIPFFHHVDRASGKAAGFFIDNLHRAHYEFTHEGSYRIHFAGGPYTEYVFAGPSLASILERYTQLTGRTQRPPVWALGYHQCRWHPYTQQGVMQLADAYRTREVPVDVLWLDIDYMNGYRVFTWDEKKYPDVAAMLASLKDRGIRVVTIIDPGVKAEPGNPLYDEGKAKGVFCRTREGDLYIGQVWPGRTVFPDFSLPETRCWWGSHNAAHVRGGIAGIWNDMNEPATGEIPPERMLFDNGAVTHDEMHNQYATLMAMGTREGLLAAEPNNRTFILSRAGSAGIQRFAANWMGDNMSRWDHLAVSLPMAMGLGLSGQSFVGSDVGGFGENSNGPLLARWIQAAALAPFCRNHNAIGNADQYPWSFGKDVEEIYRQSVALRYSLMPSIYAAFVEASETGLPVQRALAVEFQNDAKARAVEDEYLLGAHILVAPVCTPETSSRPVYLPAGVRWIDWRTGAVHEGGQTIEAKAPDDVLPMYVRAGAVVPGWPGAVQSTMAYQPETIELHVFAAPAGDAAEVESTLHEDDGVTFGFRDGACYRTEFHTTAVNGKIRITASVSGAGYPEFRRNSFTVIFHGAIPRSAQVSGSPVAMDGGEVKFANSGEGFELIAEL